MCMSKRYREGTCGVEGTRMHEPKETRSWALRAELGWPGVTFGPPANESANGYWIHK